MKAEFDLRHKIAEQIALAVDGHLNDWDAFKPEAANVYKCIRNEIRALLLQTPDASLRKQLNDMFELSVFVNISNDDSERTFCPQQRGSVSLRRRTVRRRSSAGQTFRIN